MLRGYCTQYSVFTHHQYTLNKTHRKSTKKFKKHKTYKKIH